mgnify:CR=1 FL=1
MCRDVNTVCECNRPRRSIQALRCCAFRLPRLETSMFRMLRDARCTRVIRLNCLENRPLRTPKRKRPRVVNPRAFALPRGDRGDRSPVCRRSVDGLAFVAQSRRERAQTAAVGLQCVALGDVGDGVHGKSAVSKSLWCNEGRASYAFVKTNARPFVGKRTVACNATSKSTSANQRNNGASCVHT